VYLRYTSEDIATNMPEKDKQLNILKLSIKRERISMITNNNCVYLQTKNMPT